MAPYTAEVLRVFARAAAADVGCVTFPFDREFEVVIECVAGTALHATGARYRVTFDIVDLTAMRPIVQSALVAEGGLGESTWPTPTHAFVFPVRAPGSENDGHVWKGFGHLRVGVRDAASTFAETLALLVTSP